MSNKAKIQQQEESGKGLDLVLVTLAIIAALAGVLAFTFLSEQHLGVRLACLAAGLIVGLALAWFSPSGKRFIAYGRDSLDELRLVVWPTRRETLTSTGLVMGFVLIIAFFLFIMDKIIEWGIYDVLLKLI
ncbi:preprotein translocase subunit SecE [Mesosutterella sp. AGMB02718]|uniref:Protein translocase subunit SecE n=1 Tax=Mesosutterella faecium TaxID=2925194 RepID=A0ABT7IN93_9BURK|nr:preprotein translocase subunit SecE [Mesosutterella sp. AGMB02718]MDL2058772.1 preprotein translocase subunit SecE [Mesosutterella sp. AGMB02718]